MTLDEYKKQIFKYGTDANGNEVPITIGDEFDTLPRRTRRYVQRCLNKGKVPNFEDVLFSPDEE
jgi:hypothetical protein